MNGLRATALDRYALLQPERASLNDSRPAMHASREGVKLQGECVHARDDAVEAVHATLQHETTTNGRRAHAREPTPWTGVSDAHAGSSFPASIHSRGGDII